MFYAFERIPIPSYFTVNVLYKWWRLKQACTLYLPLKGADVAFFDKCMVLVMSEPQSD